MTTEHQPVLREVTDNELPTVLDEIRTAGGCVLSYRHMRENSWRVRVRWPANIGEKRAEANLGVTFPPIGMSATLNPNPVRLVAIPEIARRAQLCGMTARRAISALHIQPDAVLVTTGRRPHVACFVESRVPEIKRALRNPQPKN